MPDRERQVLEYLAAHDLPCAKCDYNLRGLKQTRCPECGEAVTLPAERPSRGSGWAEAVLFSALSLFWGPVGFFLMVHGDFVWMLAAIAGPLLAIALAFSPFSLFGIPLLWGFYGMTIGRCRRSARWRAVLFTCIGVHASSMIAFIIWWQWIRN